MSHSRFSQPVLSIKAAAAHANKISDHPWCVADLETAIRLGLLPVTTVRRITPADLEELVWAMEAQFDHAGTNDLGWAR